MNNSITASGNDFDVTYSIPSGYKQYWWILVKYYNTKGSLDMAIDQHPFIWKAQMDKKNPELGTEVLNWKLINAEEYVLWCNLKETNK